MTSDTAEPQRAAQPASRTTEMIELEREECLELLATRNFGRVAAVMSNGTPIIRPVNYVFDERSQSVVFLTAPGSKLHALLHAAKAAFEIDAIDEISGTGWSVIIEGVTSEVTAPTDVGRLERLGLEHWAPGPRPHWVRIRAWTVSGRRIVVADDTSLEP
jgi:nitroimidazol reductase NimA-like FMN-containing flavoprotein (pyridoxamine 5'-phosphate oxidase superfamily)